MRSHLAADTLFVQGWRGGDTTCCSEIPIRSQLQSIRYNRVTDVAISYILQVSKNYIWSWGREMDVQKLLMPVVTTIGGVPYVVWAVAEVRDESFEVNSDIGAALLVFYAWLTFDLAWS